MIIDLHGLNVEKATALIINSIFSWQNDKYDNRLEIITGKGDGIMELTTLNILDNEHIKYKKINGRIIAFK